MKKAKGINPEPVLYGVIAAFAAGVLLSVAASVLIYQEVIADNHIAAIVVSVIAGIVGGFTSGKRAGKGPLPVAVLCGMIYLLFTFLLGQILFDGVGDMMYLNILAVLIGAIAGSILATKNGRGKGKRKRKRT